jgi:hypothetical protein
MVNASKPEVPPTSLASRITSHGSFRLMKWLVIVVLLVLLLLALFLPDRGLAIPATVTAPSTATVSLNAR